MEYLQLKNLYEVNGLNNYKLKATDSLLRVHGINFETVKGYSSLDNSNKRLFKSFILNFMNAWGLEERATLIPLSVTYINDKEERLSYLRFEYKHHENKNWLHVLGENDWY